MWDYPRAEDNIRQLWKLPKRDEQDQHKEDELYQEYWSDPYWDNSPQGLT